MSNLRKVTTGDSEKATVGGQDSQIVFDQQCYKTLEEIRDTLNLLVKHMETITDENFTTQE